MYKNVANLKKTNRNPDPGSPKSMQQIMIWRSLDTPKSSKNQDLEVPWPSKVTFKEQLKKTMFLDSQMGAFWAHLFTCFPSFCIQNRFRSAFVEFFM